MAPLASVWEGEEGSGCAYEWCLYIPKVTVAQFMVGFFVATAGYPFCVAVIGSLYSKVMGTIPQV